MCVWSNQQNHLFSHDLIFQWMVCWINYKYWSGSNYTSLTQCLSNICENGCCCGFQQTSNRKTCCVSGSLWLAWCIPIIFQIISRSFFANGLKVKIFMVSLVIPLISTDDYKLRDGAEAGVSNSNTSTSWPWLLTTSSSIVSVLSRTRPALERLCRKRSKRNTTKLGW